MGRWFSLSNQSQRLLALDFLLLKAQFPIACSLLWSQFATNVAHFSRIQLCLLDDKNFLNSRSQPGVATGQPLPSIVICEYWISGRSWHGTIGNYRTSLASFDFNILLSRGIIFIHQWIHYGFSWISVGLEGLYTFLLLVKALKMQCALGNDY